MRTHPANRTSFVLATSVAALFFGLATSAEAAGPKPADKGAAKPAEKAGEKAGDKAEEKAAKPSSKKNPVVVMQTSLGTIKAEIFADKAPISAENFMKYVDDKFYDGTIFHRVIKGFMIQGGGFDQKLTQKKTREPIKNEAANGLKNEVGTLAMARTMVPDSATAQFYINTVNNTSLDFRDPSPQGIGYAVFGKVLSGMDVVNKISDVKTGQQMGMGDVPATPVVIQSVRREK